MKGSWNVWFGWIPSLTGKESHVLMGHPIPEYTRYFTFIKSGNDPQRFSADFRVNNELHRAQIAIRDGFIIMFLDDMNERYQRNVANELFSTLIPCYHVDITHGGDNRLPPIKARNEREAILAYVRDIISISEDFVTLSAMTSDVEALKDMYLTRLGLIEYGKAFLDRYDGLLDRRTVEECGERLESMSHFITAIYGTVRDSIQDDLAHRSQEMSESMEGLARNTETLSMAVLGLTWFSAVMALASLSIDYGLSKPSFWVVAVTAILPPVAFLAAHRIHKRYRDAVSRSLFPSDNERPDITARCFRKCRKESRSSTSVSENFGNIINPGDRYRYYGPCAP